MIRCRPEQHVKRRRSERGYVLLFVTVALAVIAIVATRFALRIDALRQQALDLQQHAEARLLTDDAKALALYWLSTRPIGFASAGFADEKPLVMDGRLYRNAEGVFVSVQDERGLLSVNEPDREALTAALLNAGASLDMATAAIDVLQDYTDADSLRRVNGAEAPDYAALGLAPPRNDWIFSVDELARMPVWQGQPAVREQLLPHLGVRRDKLFNPNTAPLPLLKALWPKASAQQWELFDTLRRRAPFGDAAAATAATGIAFTQDNLLFHASNAVRLRLWAPGLPQSLEYNLLLMPSGTAAPWLIHELRQSRRLTPPTDVPNAAASASASPVEPFPIPSQAVAGPRQASQPAP